MEHGPRCRRRHGRSASLQKVCIIIVVDVPDLSCAGRLSSFIVHPRPSHEVAIVTTPTIAVIDDDADLLQLLNLLFDDEGWATIAFTDSAVALDALKQTPPDLIILDLWLDSARSGWDVLRDMRADPLVRTVPVIICSGATDHLRDKEPWLKELGIDSLEKPFDLDHLLKRVSSTLEAGESSQHALVSHLA